jgi:hypothetical protein
MTRMKHLPLKHLPLKHLPSSREPDRKECDKRIEACRLDGLKGEVHVSQPFAPHRKALDPEEH